MNPIEIGMTNELYEISNNHQLSDHCPKIKFMLVNADFTDRKASIENGVGSLITDTPIFRFFIYLILVVMATVSS
jgi:hypothetical protein